MKHVFTFRESRIFEAGNPVDPQGRERRVKLPKDDPARAFRQLPPAGAGRQWVLVSHEVRP